MSVLDISEIAARLEALKLQSATLQQQIQELGTLLVLAQKYSESQSKSPLTHVGEGALRAIDSTILGSGRTKRERIIEAIKEVLSDGVRRSSRYLVKELENRGIDMPGADDAKKAAALSAYLSKEGGFFESNVKEGGWTVSSLLKKAKPGNAPTLPGLFTNGSQATHP